MMRAINLPVAELAPTENTLVEIETINPVNNSGYIIASIATGEDINNVADPEIALPVPVSPVYENRNTNELPVSGLFNITLFIKARKHGLISYTPLLIIHLLYVLVNPIAFLFLLNMLYNFLTLFSCDIKLIRANIITNILTITLIIVSDIIYMFNIESLLFYFLKHEFNEYPIEMYYIITLYIASAIVIISYIYLTVILNKLRILYESFSQYQINVLKATVKRG